MNERTLLRAYGLRPVATRLADEAPLALGTALSRAHDALYAAERQLELEAPADTAVAQLFERTRLLRRDVAERLVATTIETAEVPHG